MYAGRTADQLPIPQPPYIKGKGFLPNPIVVNGIPDYADISKNPKVEGTPEYEQFWTEQLYRCVNGYQTGGIFIPGRYYYYLNFNSMATVNGVITPDVCDLHLQLAYLIDFCKDNNLNLVMPKKRRAGVSEAFQKMEVDYGYRFVPAYHAGVVAGKKTFADDFVKKWKISESLLNQEFKINPLSRNDDEISSGYIVIENGKNVEKGIKTEIYIRTAHSDPNVFKGTYLNAVICEEAGEFENFKEFYSATKDCLTDSGMQVGVMYIFGTGGNINKGSKDFKHVCERLVDFNAVLFVITGDRFKKPYYGGATTKGKLVGVTPNLSKIYKDYQLIGCEDIEAAKNDIIVERERLKKGELKLYLEHLQNNPLSLSEIFRKMFSNHFDVNVLNNQSDEISKLTVPKYSKYRLEWELNNQGTRTGRVLTIPIKGGEDESEAIYILDGYHPNKVYQNLYCAGIDPYDQDQAVSNSLGGMCVIIRRNTMGGLQMAPVAVICTRPKRKEIFFDMCLKLSVYYNLIGATLGDKAGSSGIINWYKDNGFQRMLALRPQKFESENSGQVHEYWMAINKYSKPLMIGLMQTVVLDYGQNIWFDELIKQLSNYDDVEIGSDNDLADAFGIALVQDVSVNIAPRDNSLIEKENPFILPEWQQDRHGNLVRGGENYNFDNPEKDSDYFGR